MPPAELFSVTSLCTLTSGATPPSLQRLFVLLKDHFPMTFELNCASHTLLLPLLNHVLRSHDTKSVSHDLKDSAMQVLSSAVDKYVEAVKEVRWVGLSCDMGGA